MTDRQQEPKRDKKVKIDKLEISKETVKDLTDTQAERAKGGAAGGKRLTYYDGC
jgi:hypothetical protein